MRKRIFKNKEIGRETKMRKARTTKPEKKTEDAKGDKSRLKQTTLKESFAMTTTSRRLRPRREVKNYLETTDSSSLLQKYISPAKRHSFVLVERIRPPEVVGKRAPVYKNVRMSQDKTDDENEIYEFKFDANDPSEKLTKKKRRRVAKKPAVKKATKKPQAKPIPQTEVEKTKERTAGTVKNQKILKNVKVVVEKLSVSPRLEAANDAPDFEEAENARRIKLPKDAAPKQIDAPRRTPLTDNARNKSPKPKVVSVSTLQGEKKMSVQGTSTATSGSFQPFRATNVFKSQPVPQQKNMMDHSLLNRTFSPIKNIIDATFKPDSPWRPPTLDMFSQVKQIYQSTPQPKKQSSFFGRNTLGADANRKTAVLGEKMKNIVEEKNENVNINVRNRQDKGSPLKESRPGSPKVFGAGVISEANPGTRSPGNVKTKSVRTFNQAPIAGTSRSFGTVLSETPDYPQFNDDDADNKENAEPNIQSVRKSPSKLGSPFSVQRKQIFEPLPGPSGLQKKVLEPSAAQRSRVLTELRVSKQSNLDSFLNLDEMPNSTSINTSHGIFADVHCTVQKSAASKKLQREPNVDNAFGFDDDSSDDVVQSTKSSKCKLTPIRKVLQPKKRKADELLRHRIKLPSIPARISFGEIKKTLMPAVLREKKVQKERLAEVERKEAQEERAQTHTEVEKDKKHQEVRDIVRFYDTFDLMSEDGQSAVECRTPELPLFADLEPAHFSKPPRSSYSRQSFAKRSFSEDDEEEEEVEDKKYQAKKRKIAKISKKANKQLNEWAKSINNTFQEIEEFNLVVERLP